MFDSVKERITENEKLLSTVIPFVTILVIFVNLNTLKSFFVGISALIIYLVVNGEILGRVFFGKEKHFFRLAFGLFLFIVLMAFMGILTIVVSQLEIWYLLGMIFAAIVTSLLRLFLRYDRSQVRTNEEKEPFFKDLYVIPMYCLYIGSFLLSFFVLFNERSGWVVGPIWEAIPPTFLRIYFVATVVLVGIALLPGKTTVKLLFIALHSVFSLSFLLIVLYPGIIWIDPWYELAMARVVLPVVRIIVPSGSIRSYNSLLEGFSVHVLIPTFANTLNIDMYWSYVLLVPILWGFFVPLMSYKITRMIGGGKEASIFAAFLTLSSVYFLAWGKLTTGNALGILFSFFLLYLFLRFLLSSETRIIFPIILVLITLVASHALPAVMSISFTVLAFALKKYDYLRAKFSIRAYFLLSISLVLSVLLLPGAVIIRGIIIPEIGTSAFSLDKLLSTSIWALIFGVSEELPVQEAMLHNVLPLLGLIGFVYTLQRKARFNRTLCSLLFLAFGVSTIDYRILQYAIMGGLFGAGRVKVFTEMVAIPVAAIIMRDAASSLLKETPKIRSFFKWRNFFGVILVSFCLSAWITAAVYETYEYYTYGLLPTSLEVEAVQFIDEHADGKYAVLAPLRTMVIGVGFVGRPNPGKQYFVPGYEGIPKNPSLSGMYRAMEMADTDVGYFIACSFRGSDFNKTIAEASKIFGLLEVLSNENGKIYIFHYKIPPLPRGPDVMAFYWDAPPTYYIQNDLMRTIFNPTTKTLDVADFWGDLYERIDLNKALVGGNPVGNLTSVEHFDVINEKWVEWIPDVEIPLADQFQFKLLFENDSLVGLAERGNGSVQLRWESGRAFTLSLDVGYFKRLFIPGLVAGRDSYDVNSREYGFLYTRSLADDIVLHPAYKPYLNSTSLTYNQIVKDCGFNLTEASMYYDVYVDNTADKGQWAYIEVWLPDEVYRGTFPPLRYSLDNGKTWVFAPYNVETKAPNPIKTIGGVDVNWIFTVPKSQKEKPTRWWSFFDAEGGFPDLPENYTDSGGAQSRIFFGFYLPAKDKVLVRLGTSVYWVRPLQVSYVFRDSYNVYYGLRNMERGLVKLYNLGYSEYVGGLASTTVPTALTIIQDEADKIKSILITLPSNTVLSLLSGKGIDTTIDQDENGVPDLIES